MNRLVFLYIFLFSAVSFSVTSNHTHFLNSRGTNLKEVVKAVVRDNLEVLEQVKDESKQSSFSSSGGAGSVYSIGAEDYKEKNRLTVFPDVKMAHRELPGVSDAGDYDASLYFRGGRPYETITMVNGQPVYEAFVFDGKGSLVNPNLIKETKLYTSGIPVCYPDALSGVIDIEEREGDKYQYRMESGQSLSDLQFVVEGPILRGKSSFLISLRRTYYDYLLQAMNQSANRIAPHLENYGQKFFMKLSSEQELFIDFKTYYDFYKIGNKDFNLGQSGEHSSVSRRNFFQTKLSSYWGDKLKTDFIVGMENTTISRDSLVGSDWVSERLRQEPYYIKTDLQYKENKDNLISSGLFYRQERTGKESNNLHLLGNYSYPGIAQAVSSEDYNKAYSLYGAYIQNEQTLVPDKLFLDAGLRYSFITDTALSNSKSFQPRVGLKVINDEGGTLKLSVGKYAQYSPKIVSAEYLDLFPEEAIQYNLGIEHNFGTVAEFSFSLFQKNYNSLISEQINNQGMITGYDNNKSGAATGLELLFKKKKSDGWKAMMAYTNQEAYYIDARGKYPSQHDQKDTFSISSEWDIFKDWSLALDWQYHTGRPYTDITGATSANARIGYLDNLAKLNQSRLPNYSNITLIIQHKKPIWPFDGFAGYSYMGVANILNADNIYGYVWSDDYSVKTSVKMMPMTPLFGVSVKF